MMFLLAYHGRSGWVRPKDIDIAKARSSTRINYESKGGPNMGLGHSKGTSHVKWDVLAWWVNIYIPFVHPWGEVWRTRKVDSLCSQRVWFCSGQILLQNLGLCVCYMLSMTMKWWKKYLILWKLCLFNWKYWMTLHATWIELKYLKFNSIQLKFDQIQI